MNGTFITNIQAAEGPSLTVSHAVGFGYDALNGTYINPRDVRVRYPILDIPENKIATKSEIAFESFSVASSSLVELSKQVSARLNVSGKYALFSGSVGADFEHSDKNTTEYLYYKHVGLFRKRRQYIDGGEDYKKFLNPQFLADLEGSAKLEPDALFERYGTHLITEVFLGGRIEANFSTAVHTQDTSNSIQLNVAAAYKSISADASSKYTEETKAVIKNSSVKINGVGGNGINVTAVENFAAEYKNWTTSLDKPEKCEICDLPNGAQSFVPLWELCKDADRKKALEDRFAEKAVGIIDGISGYERYVIDIQFTASGSVEAAKQDCPNGYTLIDKDLNAGARGQYIFLCYKLGKKGEAYRNICLQHFGNSQSAGENQIVHDNIKATYYRHPRDLNEGARGDYIYLLTTKESGFDPIRRVEVYVEGDNFSPDWLTGKWAGTSESADCNRGARGKYVYIKFKR